MDPNARILTPPDPAHPDPLTPARARAFLQRQPGRLLTDAAIVQFVAGCYDLGPLVGIDPAPAFAQAMLETNNGRFGGQVPITAHNVAGIGATNDSGQFLVYADWREGWRAYYVHLLAWCDMLARSANLVAASGLAALDPRLGLVAAARASKGKAVTWRDLGGRWAVPGTTYGEDIARRYDAVLALTGDVREDGGMAANGIRVALASGHHNSSGGDPFEYQQTGQLCSAHARALRAAGFDVRVVQPQDGVGTISGSLDVVGNTVVAWANGGWVPHLFIEWHTEGGGGTGAFCIYPDWDSDVDTDVRDILGPLLAHAIGEATGLGLGAGGDGIMSETQTGVGAAGSRLGIFRTTAPLAASTTRLIIECGAHDKEPDLSIARQPGFADKAAAGATRALADFFNVPLPAPPPPTPIFMTSVFVEMVRRVLGRA